MLITIKADIIAPTAPTLSTPTVLSSSSLSIALAAASVDVGGVKEYVLERALASVGTYAEVTRGLSIFPVTDTGLIASTAYLYRAYAIDNSLNQGPYSSVVTQTTASASVPVVSSSIRYTFGHYMYVDTGSGGGGLAGWKAQITGLASETSVAGAKFPFDLADVVTATRGIYDWTMLDDIVNTATAASKKLILLLRFQYFGSSTTSAAGRFPTWWNTLQSGSPGYTLWDGVNPASPAGGLILVGNLWNATVMDAYIEVSTAIANRYKDNTTVEMFGTGETSIANLPGSGYTTAAWITQLSRWCVAMRAAWPNTAVRVATNNFSTDAEMQAFFVTCVTNKITTGGPDDGPDRVYDCRSFTGNLGGIDYRDVLPRVGESQYPAGSSGQISVTSAQIYAHNESGALSVGGSSKPNYYIWFRNSSTSGGAHTWAGEILPFIRSISGASNATVPAVYTGLDYFIGTAGNDSADGRASSRPWTIDALNSKRSTYSGRVVGLLNGTYNIRTQLLAAAPDSGFFDVPAFDIAGGTPGAPTIIKAANARQAIITAKSGSNYGNFNAGNAMIGHTGQVHRGYVEIDGLKITGSNRWGIRIGIKNGSQSKFLGVAIRNNEFFDFNGATFIVTGVNFEALEMNSVSGHQVINNYYHNSQGVTAGSAGHFAASVQWDSDSGVYEYNTSKNSGGAFFAKSDGQWGNTLRYNYIDLTGLSGGAAIQDFNGYNGSAATTTDIHHNILIAEIARWGVDVSSDSPASADQVKFWNNVVISRNSGGGAFRGIYIKALAGRLRCYNNIVQDECGGDHGMMAMNTDIDGLIDRNLYYSTTASYRFISYPAPTNTTQTSYSSVNAWKSGMGAGVDTNSPASALPQFLGGGADALFYQLAGSSPAKSVGLTNGDSGSACDLGAFGNSPPARIGCDFA